MAKKIVRLEKAAPSRTDTEPSTLLHLDLNRAAGLDEPCEMVATRHRQAALGILFPTPAVWPAALCTLRRLTSATQYGNGAPTRKHAPSERRKRPKLAEIEKAREVGKRKEVHEQRTEQCSIVAR